MRSKVSGLLLKSLPDWLLDTMVERELLLVYYYTNYLYLPIVIFKLIGILISLLICLWMIRFFSVAILICIEFVGNWSIIVAFLVDIEVHLGTLHLSNNFIGLNYIVYGLNLLFFLNNKYICWIWIFSLDSVLF